MDTIDCVVFDLDDTIYEYENTSSPSDVVFIALLSSVVFKK